MNRALPLLVFSDLDGTLIDHHSYDWRPALPALKALREAGCGVVLASSKTATEIISLRAELGLTDWPAIVENGAGMLPAGQATTGRSSRYAALRAVLDQLPANLRSPFTGFGDMDAAEVSRVTGLPVDGAKAAKMRDFSEPGLWGGSDAARADFLAALGEHGVSAREGGRFLTLSFGAKKSDQMAAIIQDLSPTYTVALGDAPNDVEMIASADYGVIIANPARDPLPSLDGEATGRIIRTKAAGPMGWNTAMLGLLDQLHLTRTRT